MIILRCFVNEGPGVRLFSHGLSVTNLRGQLEEHMNTKLYKDTRIYRREIMNIKIDLCWVSNNDDTKEGTSQSLLSLMRIADDTIRSAAITAEAYPNDTLTSREFN